jgi:hypothetical protein
MPMVTPSVMSEKGTFLDRPVFAWRLKRKGAVPVPPPAPATTTPAALTTTERLINAYDTVNDFASVVGWW